MQPQPLQLANDPHVCLRGDVIVDPSAAIAPGAILQAAPNSQIVVKEGVCIGMGAVLNAYQGKIILEPGVNLGPGVLIVGNCTIGANSCIGGVSTILDTDVDAMQAIAAGSVLGDRSRQVDLNATQPQPESNKQNLEPHDLETVSGDLWASPPTPETPPPPPSPLIKGESRGNSLNKRGAKGDSLMKEKSKEEPSSQDAEQPEEIDWINPEEITQGTQGTNPVFSKVYVNQLLLTLFPQGHPLSPKKPEQ